MPGTTRLLNNEELKQAYYDGSPVHWKTSFNEAGKNIDDTTYPELIAYMRAREQDSNDKQRNNERAQHNRSGRGNHYTRSGRGGRGNGYRGASHGGRGSGDRTRRYDRQQSRNVRARHDLPERTDDNHVCYNHPDWTNPHTWGQCWQHPVNGQENRRRDQAAGRGRNGRNGRGRGNRNGRGGRGRGNGHQAHATQVPEGTADEAPAEAHHLFAAEGVPFDFGSIDWNTVDLTEASQNHGFRQMMERIPLAQAEKVQEETEEEEATPQADETEPMVTDNVARLCQTEEEVEANKKAYRNKLRNERKKEKRSQNYRRKETCPPMSIDDPNDSPPTSEEENETKEEHILKKVAIARKQAEAAHDKKRKWMKTKRERWEVEKEKWERTWAKAKADRALTPGFKNQYKMPPPKEDIASSDNPTDEETALEEEDKKMAAKDAAKQDAEIQAEKLVREEEEIESDTEHLFRPTYTNAEGQYFEYSPAKRGNQDWESPHDERCTGCREWQGKEKQSHDCNNNTDTLSICSNHSTSSLTIEPHHLDVFQIASSKANTSWVNQDNQRYTSQHGMTSMGTVTGAEQSMRDCISSTQDWLGEQESLSFLNSSVATNQGRLNELNVNQESILLEEAICHAVTSLTEDNEIYMNDEITEQQKKKSSPMHNSPSEEAPKYLNIESPLRPITFMIAEYIQGQRTKLPLKVLMDPGSDFSYIHERVLPKGAVPKTVRTVPTKTLTGVQTFDRMVELKGMILPEFSRSKKIDEIFVCYVSKQEDANIDGILENDFLSTSC